MRFVAVLGGAVAVVAVAVIVIVAVFGSEDVEHVFKSEATPYRPPHGEWVSSVPGTRAELWAVGDAGASGDPAVPALIADADPDRVLYLGDVYPNGTRDQFDRWDDEWGRLARRMAPTPGNHDWPEASEGYDPYWTDVKGTPPPTNYAFEAGGWRVLSLNSEHEEQEAQASWARAQAVSSDGCAIAFWHRPRWSAGPHGDGPAVDGLWRAVRGRVAAVISGHEHNMQRLAVRGGTVQFVSGAGGFSHTEPDPGDTRLAFGDGTQYGALRLRLTPGVAKWAFVATDGTRLDSGLMRCHETVSRG